MKRVLITGGSGLLGRKLVSALQKAGKDVRILSRSPQGSSEYLWDLAHDYIDPTALEGIEAIIHLAGASVGEGRWTKKRKQVLIDSRVKSTFLLLTASKDSQQLKTFISASAIGYYGQQNSEHIFQEEDSPGNDFLGKLCQQWEAASSAFEERGIRNVQLRTGIVLSETGGALPKMIKSFRMKMGALLGNGKQYMPWIHIDDMVQVYIEALENHSFQGAYNTVAPEHHSNATFTRNLADTLHLPLWPIPVPAFVLKLWFGEQSCILLQGSRVSSQKLQALNFNFQYPTLDLALQSLLSNSH